MYSVLWCEKTVIRISNPLKSTKMGDDITSQWITPLHVIRKPSNIFLFVFLTSKALSPCTFQKCLILVSKGGLGDLTDIPTYLEKSSKGLKSIVETIKESLFDNLVQFNIV